MGDTNELTISILEHGGQENEFTIPRYKRIHYLTSGPYSCRVKGCKGVFDIRSDRSTHERLHEIKDTSTIVHGQPLDSGNRNISSPCKDQLDNLCRARRLSPPQYTMLSDRRGGRTAWSCQLILLSKVILARFWYDGTNSLSAVEDAAQQALQFLGTQSSSDIAGRQMKASMNARASTIASYDTDSREQRTRDISIRDERVKR